MERMIFMLVAVLILLPIIYFLPLGFSRRGKGLIVLASLLISLLGIIAVSAFSLWQTILIEILVVALVGLLMVKRSDDLLLETVEEQDVVQNDHDEIQHRLDSLSDTYKHIALSDKHTKVPENADDSIQTGWTREEINFEQKTQEASFRPGEDLIEVDRTELELGFENDLNKYDIESVDEDAGYLPEIDGFFAGKEQDRPDWNHSVEDELEETFFEPYGRQQTENEIEERASFDGWDEEELPEIVFEEQKEPEKV